VDLLRGGLGRRGREEGVRPAAAKRRRGPERRDRRARLERAFTGIREGLEQSATKGAVELLARALSLELSPLGIRANVIAPGNVLTSMNEHLRALPGYEERVSGETPAGRFGEPEEIAAAVVFFASDAASFVHGASLLVDGGWIAR
jgi:NAD(P)-dependent dehydrogenase (short-subunit alcohol dehydrogenase family)